MKKKLIILCTTLIALVLEILPYGAVCNFANPEGEPWRRTYSYFDLTPFGYANFAPFLTALITCLIFILLLIYWLKGNAVFAIKAKNILYVAAVMSLGPLVFGLSYFSVVGALITTCLIAELLLLQFRIKQIVE